MRIPLDTLFGAVKMGASSLREGAAPVHVAVLVDAGASRQQAAWLREALVPQTVTALVRVAALDDGDPEIKPDTDLAIVLAGNSGRLEAAVRSVLIAGVPCVVVAESAVAAPFACGDAPMLGLVASQDRTAMLQGIARWVVARSDKRTAFAAAFPFMRIAAAARAVRSASFTNMATGALAFVPGADFPAMTLVQAGMLLELASIFGKPIRPERAYELAALGCCALAFRAAARAACGALPRWSFAIKALVAGAGTLGAGRALCAFYERDFDYAPLNEFIGGAFARIRDIVVPDPVPTV